MTKDIWLNLPVADVSKARAFYTAIGFPLNEQFQQTNTAGCLHIANKLIVLFFDQATYQGFAQVPGYLEEEKSEVLISIDAESRKEVDELAQKVVDAGGKLFGKPGENQGWMYGFGFLDLDGHRWNCVHMDWSKMPR